MRRETLDLDLVAIRGGFRGVVPPPPSHPDNFKYFTPHKRVKRVYSVNLRPLGTCDPVVAPPSLNTLDPLALALCVAFRRLLCTRKCRKTDASKFHSRSLKTQVSAASERVSGEGSFDKSPCRILGTMRPWSPEL